MNLPTEVRSKERRMITWVRLWRGPILGAAVVVASASFLWVSILTVQNSETVKEVKQNGVEAECRSAAKIPLDTAMAELATAQADLLLIATQAELAVLSSNDDIAASVAASMPVAQSNLTNATANAHDAIVTYVAEFQNCSDV